MAGAKINRSETLITESYPEGKKRYVNVGMNKDVIPTPSQVPSFYVGD